MPPPPYPTLVGVGRVCSGMANLRLCVVILQSEHDDVEAAFQAEKRALEMKYEAKFGEWA